MDIVGIVVDSDAMPNAAQKQLAHSPRELTPEGVPYDTFAARLAVVRVFLGGWNVAKTVAYFGEMDDASWRNWEGGGNCRNQEWVCMKINRATGISYEWLISGGPLARNRCFTLKPVPTRQWEQLELSDQTGGQLALVGSMALAQ